MRRRIWLPVALLLAACLIGITIVWAGADQWAASCIGPLKSEVNTQVTAKVRQALPPLTQGTSVALEVIDLESCTEVVKLDADSPFPTASVVKLLIAVDALERSGDQNQIRRMLSASDDAIASSLWTAGGGPAIIGRMTAKLQLKNTRPPEKPGQWGDTVMSAHDVALTYLHLTSTVDGDTRELVFEALAAAPRSAADGFQQHFGIPDGMPGRTWAVKQGWGSSGTHTVLNTTGVVQGDRDLVVVLLTTWPKDSDRGASTAAVTKAVTELDALFSVTAPAAPMFG